MLFGKECMECDHVNTY